MVTMNDIMNNFLGDWMYDQSKLEALTEEQAIQDIWLMDASPDYGSVEPAIKLAAERFNCSEAEFIAKVTFNRNADKVS